MPKRKEAGTHIYANTYRFADGVDFKSDFYLEYCKHKRWQPTQDLPEALANEARIAFNIYLSKQIATLNDNDRFKTVTERRRELSDIYHDICLLRKKNPSGDALSHAADAIQHLCFHLKHTSARAVLTKGFDRMPHSSFIHFDFLNRTVSDEEINQHLLQLRANISEAMRTIQASISESGHFSDMVRYHLKIWHILFQGMSANSKYPYGHTSLEIFAGIMPSLRLPNRSYRSTNTMTTIFHEWLCSLFLQLPQDDLQRLCPTNGQIVDFLKHIDKKPSLRFS